MFVFGRALLDSEIPFFLKACSNQYGKNVLRQYMADSFTGAVPSRVQTYCLNLRTLQPREIC